MVRRHLRLSRMRRNDLIWIALPLILGGCLAPKPISLTPSAGAIVVDNVPLERWGDNRCGAGALSTILRHFGDPVTEQELIPLLPQGRNDGVVSVDLLLAARERGFDARIVRGDLVLLEQLMRDRIPAIVMLQVANLRGVENDLYHYVVLDGYDPGRKIFRMQYGDGRWRWASLAGLAHAWDNTDRATLVVTGRAEESATLPSDGVRRAVALEDAGRADEAVSLYRALLERHPDSSLVWTNLGNALTRLDRPAEAEEAYRRALELDPDNRDALNNLAWLLLQNDQELREAEELSRRAAAIPGPDSELYDDTLGRILRRRGQCREAIEVFARALESLPANAPARADILLELGLSRRDCGDEAGADEDFRAAMALGPPPDVTAAIRQAMSELTR